MLSCRPIAGCNLSLRHSRLPYNNYVNSQNYKSWKGKCKPKKLPYHSPPPPPPTSPSLILSAGWRNCRCCYLFCCGPGTAALCSSHPHLSWIWCRCSRLSWKFAQNILTSFFLFLIFLSFFLSFFLSVRTTVHYLHHWWIKINKQHQRVFSYVQLVIWFTHAVSLME